MVKEWENGRREQRPCSRTHQYVQYTMWAARVNCITIDLFIQSDLKLKKRKVKKNK